jgi:PAS domain-containing protein
MIDHNTLNAANESAMVVALAAVRQSVLQRATALLGDRSPLPFTEQFDALPAVSALLMTSLEELKVAEEELRTQNTLLLEQRAGIDQRAQRYHALFLNAPMAALVTDTTGTIHEANFAAGRLLRRGVGALEQKPIHALVPANARETFRREFARFSPANGVADWRFMVGRVGDLPVQVSARVELVPRAGRNGADGLYWLLTPLDTGG